MICLCLRPKMGGVTNRKGCCHKTDTKFWSASSCACVQEEERVFEKTGHTLTNLPLRFGSFALTCSLCACELVLSSLRSLSTRVVPPQSKKGQGQAMRGFIRRRHSNTQTTNRCPKPENCETPTNKSQTHKHTTTRKADSKKIGLASV
jgi:hypothetical protein